MSLDVAAKIEDWRGRLLDLSKRNRLIHCKIGPRGALELLHPAPAEIWQRLLGTDTPLTFAWKSSLVDEDVQASELTTQAGKSSLFADDGKTPDTERTIPLQECLESTRLCPHDVLTPLADGKLKNRIKRLKQNAQSSIDEQGVNILYLGFGLLKWYESLVSDVENLSPLLLVPVRLTRKNLNSPWTISIEDDELISNQCLQEMLRKSFEIQLPELTAENGDEGPNPFDYFKKIERILAEQPLAKRWSIQQRVILGTFSFQKIAMWQDLGKNSQSIAAHGICRGIAGDTAALSGGGGDLPTQTEYDETIHPKTVHSILDSDGSQCEAILAARNGLSFVLDGPPGTGKSQTIANIIAECLADGKRVLFVSEKMAALEVVKKRFSVRDKDDKEQDMIGDFCLECHSHKAKPLSVVAELMRCLNLQREGSPPQDDELERLHDIRRKLNQYVRSIHRPQGELQLTPYHAHGRLSSLRTVRDTRCPIQSPERMTASSLREIDALLKRLQQFHSVLKHYNTHPWRGVKTNSFSFTLQSDIQHEFTSLANHLDDTQPHVETLQKHGLAESDTSYSSLPTVISHVAELLNYPQFPQAWFAGDPAVLSQDVLNLDAAQQDIQRAANLIPQFDLRVPNSLTDIISRILQYRDDPLLRRVQVEQAGTLRRLRQMLDLACRSLATLHKEVDELWFDADNLAKLLSVRLSPNSTIEIVRKLAQIGSIAGETGPIHPNWLDQGVRNRISQTASTCQQHLSKCREIKEAKAALWNGSAFQAVGREISDEATDFATIGRRIVGRINGRWPRFRSRADGLYSKQIAPSTKSLLRDMEQLRAYHAHQANAIESQKSCIGSLVYHANGQVDWKRVRDGINAIARIQAINPLSESLKKALTSETGVNRENLRTSAAAVLATLTKIGMNVQATNKAYAMNDFGGGRSDYQTLSCGDLVAWISQAEQAVGKLLTDVTIAEKSLRPNADILLDELSGVCIRLVDLEQMNSAAEPLRVKLSGVPGIAGPLLYNSNSAHLRPEDVKAIVSLKEFVAKYGARPLKSLVDFVSNADARSEAHDAGERLRELSREKMAPCWNTIADIFSLTTPVSNGIVLEKASLQSCSAWLRKMVEDLPQLQEWIDFKEIENGLSQHNLQEIIAEVVNGHIPLDDALVAFQSRFYRCWLDSVYSRDPVLRSFKVEDHEANLKTFQHLDKEFVKNAYKRIRSQLLDDVDRPHSNMFNVPQTSELGILLHESNKRRRLMPLRRLFRQIPEMLQRLKPCIMMSPLAVSTFLDSSDIIFDVVIFDEASQVRPHDAIGAIYRGAQLIVAGDQKQLPPTQFFDRLDAEDDADWAEEGGEEDAGNNLGDYESILDVCCTLGMSRKRLRWHYRSRRESLIAFSNHLFYDNKLVTFPSVFDVKGKSAVRFHHVKDGVWLPGTAGGFNPNEAKETARLIVEHFENQPKRSLGVITFNQKQQTAVLDELEKIAQKRPDLEDLLDGSNDVKLFIKNLENVQGDERDRIILSIGYGYDGAGKFAMRFGPLNQKGGERRLNVAVTRARYETTLVSSIRAGDIDLANTNSEGVKLLRAFLDYAERGTEAIVGLVTETPGAEHDSPFEAEVENSLRQHGLEVRRQVGCSGFRIDLALTHPQHPGQYLLGIECDGATYHSSAMARDRDRLRQEVLEGLGWTICRVWSTDWVRNPAKQIARIVAAYEAQLKKVDQEELSTEISQECQAAESDNDSHTSDESITSDEQPHLKIRRATDDDLVTPGKYANVDDVPNGVLQQIISNLLGRVGQTSREQLITAVARELGFLRTGKRIQESVGSAIDQMVRRGVVRSSEEGLLFVGNGR